MGGKANLVERIRERSAELGEAPVLTSILDAETTERVLSFAELDRRARAVAASLEATCAVGERGGLRPISSKQASSRNGSHRSFSAIRWRRRDAPGLR